jgi:hypothetical protein
VTDRAFILDRTNPLKRSRRICEVVDHLEDLPMGRSWRVTVEEAKSERSLQQNKYLFGVAYKLISETTGCEKQDIHTDMLKQHFGTKLKKVPRSKYHPDGLDELPVRTTTTDEKGRRSVLGKMQFAEFVDFVHRWAVTNLGLYIPAPNEPCEDEQERAA